MPSQQLIKWADFAQSARDYVIGRGLRSCDGVVTAGRTLSSSAIRLVVCVVTTYFARDVRSVGRDLARTGDGSRFRVLFIFLCTRPCMRNERRYILAGVFMCCASRSARSLQRCPLRVTFTICLSVFFYRLWFARATLRARGAAPMTRFDLG